MSDILTKIKSTADILGGTVFFANEQGTDPENEGVELLPNGMYIRLDGSDGSVAYISAHEIDKAIGIIGQMSMSKASQSDVDSIIEMLDEKVSKTELEILRTDIADKVNDDDFNDLAGIVANKAERSDVETLVSQVINKAEKTEVETLKNRVNSKVSTEEFNTLSESVNSKTLEIENIKADIVALQSAMNSVSDSNSITALQNQINYLNSELNKKLTVSDLSGVNASIINLSDADSELNERLSNVETNLNKKASTVYVQGQVNELNNAITGISARVDSKADKETVAKKASKSDLETLTAKVTKLSNEFNNTKNEFESLNNNIYNDLAEKASVENLTSEVSRLEGILNTKSNIADIESEVNAIDSRIETLEENTGNSINDLYSKIDEIECETTNSLNEFNSNLTYQTRKIEEHSKDINNLKRTDTDLENKLKKQWVRVMTPEEYNSLAPVNENNPYAKQPNVVYMLVRYNKPIAIYVGDICIAKAEQRGSTGFAYTFPITF